MDYLPPKTTITGDYYCKISERLRNSIKHKRRGLLSQGVLLLHDNAPAHRSVIAQQTIRDCGFIQLGHPACSPGLVPSDYYLFRHLKKFLRGIRFEDDEAVKGAFYLLLGVCRQTVAMATQVSTFSILFSTFVLLKDGTF